MKNLILLFLVFFLSYNLVNAQIGIRAGVNYANLTGDIADNDAIIAWQVGPYIDFALSESTDLNLAVMFSKKGTEDSMTDIVSSINYLEIPLQLRFHLAPIFFQIGGFGGYVLSSDRDGEDLEDFIKSGDYGILFGAGVQFGNIRLDGRYSLGLANVSEIDTEDIKTSVLTLGIEIGF